MIRQLETERDQLRTSFIAEEAQKRALQEQITQSTQEHGKSKIAYIKKHFKRISYFWILFITLLYLHVDISVFVSKKFNINFKQIS